MESEERNQLYHTNLDHNPALAVQRDIFVFQCLIGCRVGDLYKLTKSNVINEGIKYIPRKTKDGRPVTVCVPLNSIAKEILARYQHLPFDELLPMISQQKYNVAIKKMFLEAGLSRPVVILILLQVNRKLALGEILGAFYLYQKWLLYGFQVIRKCRTQ